uniref:CRIB domain-containing protein n=1 Tax=Denticeps clupeoides TaxID=299321 RepID=A0AAY4C7E3_9TELE
MSLGKLPGIKGLVSSSQGRRRFKSDLSVDMISPPLGDFRHTMHVGRGGDVFGDTSFLSNHGGSREAGPSGPESPTSASKTHLWDLIHGGWRPLRLNNYLWESLVRGPTLSLLLSHCSRWGNTCTRVQRPDKQTDARRQLQQRGE